MSRISIAASRRRFLAGMAAAPVALALGAPARADRSGADMILIALADLHSAYGRLPGIVRAVRDIVASAQGTPVAILLNGDVFERGNAVAKNSEGMADWAFLGALRASAPLIYNIGNHEVALRDDLTSLVTGVKRIGAHIVSNVMDNRTGGFFAPVSARVAMGRRRIGVMGLASNDPLAWREAARDALGLLDPESFAGSMMTSAFTGADLPIVMSHAGLAADKRILAKLPAGALMIGAHDHLTLEHRENGGLYVHTGCWGESLSVISVRFAPEGPQFEVETVAIAADAPQDLAISGIVKAATLAFLPIDGREIIGALPRALSRTESMLFAADAVRRAAGADIALLNHSAFGAPLPGGGLRRYDLDNFVRFDGDVMTAEVDGATLAAILKGANQHDAATLDARTGDYVHARALTPEAGRMYRVATSGWVAGRQAAYLGAEGVNFVPAPDVAIKTSIEAALRAAG
jgi:2',3'-cyclic-nucleotide 2'-phosphodiesterase (5'-nucleotidase family)